jgi:hypothetical protein
MKLDKESLDKLNIWWNLAFENNDTETYNKCSDVCYALIGKHVEMYRYKKVGKKWEELKMNSLAYIPEIYLDTDGILSYYYTKDDIIRLCGENKVIGKYVWQNIKGERVEDYIKDLKEQYFQYFILEPTASLYKSHLSINMFKILTDKQKEDVLEVLDKKTGRRKE